MKQNEERWFKILLGMLLCAYIASLLVFIVGIDVFNSPDEHASALFIEKVQMGELPRISEPRNALVYNVLHPRSTTVIEDWIVPIGFLGLPWWYGIFSTLLPFIPATFFTPCLVLMALYAWYLLQKELFASKKMAFISVVLLATLPAFWFYATRSFMPNVPFICLLIIASAIFILRSKQFPFFVHALFAGFLFGIAFSFRLFELPWLLLLMAYYLFLKRKTHTWKDILSLCLGMIGGLLPTFFAQKLLYMSPWMTGYTAVSESENIVSQTMPTLFEKISNLLLPFGFHERLIVAHVFENVFLLMPLFVVFTGIGIGYVLFKKQEYIYVRLLIPPLVVIGIWLFIVYGSWSIADNPDIHAITLANSYSRYWLPIYVLAIPFAVIGLVRLAHVIAPKKAHLAIAVLLSFWISMSVFTVLQGDDGLLRTRARLQVFAQDRAELLQAIPDNAIVITKYADKYLYPHRTVAIDLMAQEVRNALPRLLTMAPVYYFGITLPPQDMVFYQKMVLCEAGIAYQLAPILAVREQTLYQFIASDICSSSL